MRIVRFALLILATALVGCGGSDAGADTSEPAGGDNAAECSPQGDVISVVAVAGSKNAFDKDCLAVRAGQASTLNLENPDNEPHNVSVFVERGGENLFRGEIIGPEESTSYSLPAIEAGRYYFQCDVHPEMNGTFVSAE